MQYLDKQYEWVTQSVCIFNTYDLCMGVHVQGEKVRERERERERERDETKTD